MVSRTNLYVMTSHFNMLCAFMEDRIFSNLDGTGIVGIERGRARLWKAKLKKKTPKPDKFRSGGIHSTIFCFCG